MIFAAPIAGLLAGLLGAAIVLLLYMLKLRRRPVPVSTTMLWSRAVRDMEGNVPWQAARPSMLLVLHLFIVALIALAIARPSIGTTASEQRVIIVIDTSASMNAAVGSNGETRLEIARQIASDRVRALTRASGTPELTVYRVGGGARMVSGPTRDTRQVLRAINAIEPSDEAGDLSGVIEQIRATLIRTGSAETLVEEDPGIDRGAEGTARVLVLSDGGRGAIPGTIDGAGVETIVPDAPPAANIGIVALSAERDRTTPSICRVFARVQSTGPDPVGLILRVLDSGAELARGAIAFDPAENTVVSKTASLEFTLDSEAELEVVIDHSDALEADNRAWVRVPDPRPVRVVVVAAGEAHPILLDVLSVIAGREPGVIQPGEQIPAWAQLVVLDGVGAPEMGSLPSIAFGPSSDRGPYEQVVSWKRSHPVLRDVAMGLVAFDSPAILDQQRVLASSELSPVLTERAAEGVRHLEIAFDLDRSNWPVQVGFAIFLANAIEYLVPGASGVGEVTRTSELRPRVGPQEIRAGEGIEVVGVSLLSEDESRAGNIERQGGSEPASGMGRGPRVGVDRPVWRWFVLAALVLMTIEWVLHAARVRV